MHVTSRRYTLFDLSGEDGVVSQLSVLRLDEMLVTGRQVYDPTLEQVFPVCDPRNPSHVHQAYADPSDARRCCPRVALRDVSFYRKNSLAVSESALWNYLASHFPDHSFASQAAFIEALKASCRAEITATLEGRKPPSCDSVEIRKLSAADCDSEAEARALAGQYGGLLKDYAPEQQPSLRNGRIVCLFGGALLKTRADEADYIGAFGAAALDEYAAEVKQFYGARMMCWAPYGGGNMAAYFNTAFRAGADGSLVVDPEQVNATFVPVKLDLLDRDGRPRVETMLAVVQIRPVREGRQIKLDYGDRFSLAPSAPEVSIKTETV